MIDLTLKALIWARLFYNTIEVVKHAIKLVVLYQILLAVLGSGRWSDLPTTLILIWLYVCMWRTRALLINKFGGLLTVDWEIAQQAVRSAFIKESREWHKAQEWKVAE